MSAKLRMLISRGGARSRLRLGAAVCALALSLCDGVGAAAVRLVCPATADGPKELGSGWYKGTLATTGAPAKSAHGAALEGITIINGRPGDETAEAPASLVPDHESQKDGRTRQVWDLDDYRADGVLLVCRYRGVASYFATSIPEALHCSW